MSRKLHEFGAWCEQAYGLLMAADNSDAILGTVTRLAREIGGADVASVWTFARTDGGDVLSLAALAAPSGVTVEESIYGDEHTAFCQTLRDGQCVIMRHGVLDPVTRSQLRAYLQPLGLQVDVAVPMCLHERCIGAFRVGFRQRRNVTDKDLEALQRVAGALARALYRVVRIEELRVAERRQVAALRLALDEKERLLEVMTDAVISTNSDGIILSVTEKACDLLGEHPEELCNRNITEVLPPEIYPFGEDRRQQSYQEIRFVRRDGRELWLGVRRSREAGPDNPLVTWLLRDITAERGLLRRLEELEAKANEDYLTGIPNRRSIADRLSVALTEAHRSGGALCVALLDVDHFKRVNDEYGHDVGDSVLRAVVWRVRQALRNIDQVGRAGFGRWGGEEFLLLLPGVSGQQAVNVLERVRLAVSEKPIEYAPGKTLKITVSIGATDYVRPAVISDVLRVADEALYQAKDEGRNRVCHRPMELEVGQLALQIEP